MLRRASSDQLHAKTNDSILRHKVRNLRAKIKTLLPMHHCQKASRRDKVVKKMEENISRQFNFCQTQKRWTHSQDSARPLYCCEKENNNFLSIFSKLSDQQIQQIKEDVFYYIGEDHIEKFEQFLKLKEKKIANNTTMMNFNATTNRMKSMKLNGRQRESQGNHQKSLNSKVEVFVQEQPNFNSQKFNEGYSRYLKRNANLSTNKLLQSRGSSKNLSFVNWKKLNSSANKQAFQIKRKIIQQQLNTYRIITKMNTQIKQEKALDLFKETQSKFISTVKQKNRQNDIKIRKINQDLKKKNVTFGQIVQLSENLREIYIKRLTSSAQFKSRYANN